MSLDEPFKNVLRRRIETARCRRDPGFQERLRGAVDTAIKAGASGGSRLVVRLESLCVDEMWERADLWVALAKEQVREMDLRVHEDTATGLKALLQQEFEKEMRTAKGLIYRTLSHDTMLSGTLTNVLEPGRVYIANEIQALHMRHEANAVRLAVCCGRVSDYV